MRRDGGVVGGDERREGVGVGVERHQHESLEYLALGVSVAEEALERAGAVEEGVDVGVGQRPPRGVQRALDGGGAPHGTNHASLSGRRHAAPSKSTSEGERKAPPRPVCETHVSTMYAAAGVAPWSPRIRGTTHSNE